MLRAIVNFPALSQQFRQSSKKAITKLEDKSRHTKAVHTLRTYGLDDCNANNVEVLDNLALQLE